MSEAPVSAPAPRPAVIIGAGPAGLATSYELGRRGIDHLVLVSISPPLVATRHASPSR